MTSTPGAVAIHDREQAVRSAIARYVEKYAILESTVRRVTALSYNPAFIEFVSRLEGQVIGEDPQHALDNALDEALVWAVGAVEVLDTGLVTRLPLARPMPSLQPDRVVFK